MNSSSQPKTIREIMQDEAKSNASGAIAAILGKSKPAQTNPKKNRP